MHNTQILCIRMKPHPQSYRLATRGRFKNGNEFLQMLISVSIGYTSSNFWRETCIPNYFSIAISFSRCSFFFFFRCSYFKGIYVYLKFQILTRGSMHLVLGKWVFILSERLKGWTVKLPSCTEGFMNEFTAMYKAWKNFAIETKKPGFFPSWSL